MPPESAQRLVDSLKDYASDFRVSKSHLSKLKLSVFGLGGSYYSADFCRAAKDIHGGWIIFDFGSFLFLAIVEVKTVQQHLGLSFSTFDKHRLANVVLSGHFRVRKYDIPVQL